MPLMSWLTSTALGSSGWRRAKASSRWVRAAARLAAPIALSMKLCTSSYRPSRMRRFTTSIEPMMAVSMLLKSCAIPPVSWPIASIFCEWRSASSAWRNASSASRSAVTSRPTA